MSNAILDRPETDVMPFTLLWGEEAHNDVTSESEWVFSEPTQGLTSFSASSRDKPYLSKFGQDGEDIGTTIG